MQDILKAPFIIQMCKTTANMYRLGWDERNGGNLSVILDEDEVSQYLDLNKTLRVIPMDFDASFLAGRILLVTGTGRYFKNIIDDPEKNLGIIKISGDGRAAELLWGYVGGGRPTSELPAHLMSHIERLKVDPLHRVIMHCHPNNTLAMTFVHTLDEREFTRTLWRMITECIVVFPDGVAVLPWMVCGNPRIGRETADRLKSFRVCVWAQHGIFGTGRDLDEAFGLIETVEKGATIYMKIAHLKILQSITDEQLLEVCKDFNLTPRDGYLG